MVAAPAAAANALTCVLEHASGGGTQYGLECLVNSTQRETMQRACVRKRNSAGNWPETQRNAMWPAMETHATTECRTGVELDEKKVLRRKTSHEERRVCLGKLCTAKVFISKTCRVRAARGLPMEISLMGTFTNGTRKRRRKRRTTATGDHPQPIRRSTSRNQGYMGRAPNAPTVGKGRQWAVQILRGTGYSATDSKDNHIGGELKGDGATIPGIGGHVGCEGRRGDGQRRRKWEPKSQDTHCTMGSMGAVGQQVADGAVLVPSTRTMRSEAIANKCNMKYQ